MDLYVLGKISWWESQCYYHALAELGREGLVLCCPDEPYVCLGVHDDLYQEIDIDYCEANNIHLLRRKIGGGVVLLDENQFFYQVVLKKDNEMIPMRRELLFKKMLQPAIHVYEKLGMQTRWKAPADLVFGRLKCSGNGAGEIGDCVALSGNVLFNFDYKGMAQVLKSPNAMYAEILKESMRNNMCTVAEYQSKPVPRDLVTGWFCEAFEPIFGELRPAEVDDELKQQISLSRKALTDPEWLKKPGRRNTTRKVKISEGVYLHYVKCGDNEYIFQTRDELIEEFYVLRQGQTHREKSYECKPYNTEIADIQQIK